MTRLILVRHGYTFWNEEKKYQGFSDINLNPQGIEEARKLAKRLSFEKIDMIYSSPLKRSLETAEIVNENFKQKIHIRDCLKEINFGDWEGFTFEEIVSHYPELSDEWLAKPADMRPPNGENFRDLQERAIKVLHEIYDLNKGKNVLIVTHGGLISVIVCHILKIGLDDLWKFISSNTGITILEELDNKLLLTTFNEAGHLKYF